ncbi:MAG: hypothetical protein VR65_02810 [Desulfobulbaceae bacterium BRH_c16a]|nr:MAG: hypothetical protein VR65_02810 [Desulfobulbaceae bacterium BRH_c16a]
MNNKLAALFFDKNDYELLRIVNDVLARDSKTEALRSLLSEHMHPHGIKEMAAPKGLRIAYAIAGLLGSFEQGQARDRIKALRSLRDEVFLSSNTFFQKNTARVLLQIMKDLVRSGDNELRQLKLAHDFRMVSTGNPRHVRAELAKYHLLEMPEEWNQFAFDDHVHDANTKGRKSPTHLVMDAWIKGIRHLTVVYYNFVAPEVVEELVEASAILDMRVQVGIEMSSRFRDKYVRITWEPHGFHDNRAFLKFLGGDPVKELMEKGRHVSHYQQRYIFEVLAVFNDRHRLQLNKDLELSLEPLQENDFIRFVGAGQPSVLHFARFIHNAVVDNVRQAVSAIREESAGGSPSLTERVRLYHERLRKMGVERIIEEFLVPSRNPEISNPNHPRESHDLPDLLRLNPPELLRLLLSLHSSSRFTLNLSNLTVQDTMELLYSCEGMISHIEAYNLKNAAHGMSANVAVGTGGVAGEAVDLKSPEYHYRLIGDLQKALNEDNVIGLKRAIRAIIWDFEEQRLRLEKHVALLPAESEGKERLDDEYQQMQERKRHLMDILYHLETFHNCYRKRSLGSRIGSGSTGQAEDHYGMGLIVLDTLPARARKVVREGVAGKHRMLIPVSAFLTRNSHRRCHENGEIPKKTGLLANIPLLKFSPFRQWHDWSLDALLVHPGTSGNIATLGGLNRNGESGRRFAGGKKEERLGNPYKYLNTNLKNSLKVLLGFIPAFLTFSLTKDWWLLAYLGAFIWFGITGSRNIIQSVLGGGGLRRSPLLPWNSLVSWSRIADSLLYTGFSVPLLDYLIKTLLLDRTFGITTANNPVLLYAAMGLANGIYISSHNIFRGLPRTAAVGNFFRSILAIPLAILLNSVIGMVLQAAVIPGVADILQKWAAIISKLASDCVAAVIEGLADRQTNIRARLAAYRAKMAQLFGVFSRLDLLFPEEDVLEMLQSPKMMMETLNYEAREQERLIIVNALDLMYLWMYQPRARKALTIIFAGMSREEWLIFYRSQLVLKRYREISQIFVDGLVGRNFSKALSFYLDRFEGYLADMEKLGLTKKWV